MRQQYSETLRGGASHDFYPPSRREPPRFHLSAVLGTTSPPYWECWFVIRLPLKIAAPHTGSLGPAPVFEARKLYAAESV